MVPQILCRPAHGGDRGLQSAQLAAAARLEQLAAPGARVTQAGPHRCALLTRHRVGWAWSQQRRHRAQQLLAWHAQDLGVGRVDIQGAQIGIGDQQALVQVLEQAHRHQLALLGIAAFLHVGQRRQQAQWQTGAVALDDHQRHLGPAPSTALRHAQLDPASAGFTRAQGQDGLARDRPVFGVETGLPRRGCPALGAMPAQRAPSGGSKTLIALQMPIGHAQARAVQRPFPALRPRAPVDDRRVRGQQDRQCRSEPDRQAPSRVCGSSPERQPGARTACDQQGGTQQARRGQAELAAQGQGQHHHLRHEQGQRRQR